MQSSKDALKNLASQIESLAREVQKKVTAGEDFLPACNELTRNATTLVFTCGEVYALDKQTPSLTSSVKPARARHANYHNVRNSLGRFAPRV